MLKYGEKFAQIWPQENVPVISEFGKKLLVECTKIEKASFGSTTVEAIIKRSDSFPIPFPIASCRIKSQPEDRMEPIRTQLASAYPVLHERALYLLLNFLEHKSKFANKVEKEIYPKLSLTDFVHRLLTKRCASFFGKNDRYLLLSRESGSGGFLQVGTESERAPLVLRDVLSYDEIKLSALLSVSSHSEFLNDGNRKNRGEVVADVSKIERDGVVIGLIGARLSRPGVMEFQDIIISESHNTVQNGYGPKDTNDLTAKTSYRKVWNDFYEEDDFLFTKIVNNGKRFGPSKQAGDIFDNFVMKKRYAISFDTLLLDSEARAAAANKRAYIHVVGIGLGVWKTAKQQEEIFLLTFAERIKFLLPNLKHVSFIHFSWFHMTECGDLKNGGLFKSDNHPDGGIKTFISKRNPADKLPRPEHENTLLIVSYAWDGNALPGNEFWMKKLDSTGDSSTACSTLITEIHNPHINTKMVCGVNLHIASPKYGILHIGEYCKKVLQI